MPREMSPQRRRVIMLAAAVACLGGFVSPLTHGHPYVSGAVLVLMVLALVYAIRELFKLKRAGNCR